MVKMASFGSLVNACMPSDTRWLKTVLFSLHGRGLCLFISFSMLESDYLAKAVSRVIGFIEAPIFLC